MADAVTVGVGVGAVPVVAEGLGVAVGVTGAVRASSARTSCTPMLIVRIAVAEITMAATTAVVGSDRRGLSANLHRHLAPRKASSAASTSAGCEGKN